MLLKLLWRADKICEDTDENGEIDEDFDEFQSRFRADMPIFPLPVTSCCSFSTFDAEGWF